MVDTRFQPILVLGGGQLGLMMAEAGVRLGTVVDRLDTATNEVIPGTSNLRIEMDIAQLLDRYPVITAEMEHLPQNDFVHALKSSENWRNARAFDILPSRDSQKRLLDDIGVANAPWNMLNEASDLAFAHHALGDELIVKTTRGGYDGKGQWVVKQGLESAELDIPRSAWGALIAEKKMPFSREVSLIGARRDDGQCVFYPLVENHHHNGILRFSIAPAANAGPLQLDAESMLKKIMDELGYVGVMAMECFEIDGHVIVNELAPRVHNSGHWSQMGSTVNQFELHVRALSGHRFPEQGLSRQANPTLMLNLIGCEYHENWNEIDGVQCYWYGKTRRDNRKLGHINLSIDAVGQVPAGRVLRPYLDDVHGAMLDLAMQRLYSIAENIRANGNE